MKNLNVKMMLMITIILLSGNTFLYSTTATVTKIQNSNCSGCSGKILIHFDITCDPAMPVSFLIQNGNTTLIQEEVIAPSSAWSKEFVLDNLCPGTYQIFAGFAFYKVQPINNWGYLEYANTTITITGPAAPLTITGDYGPRVKDCFGSGWCEYTLNSEAELGTITWTKDGNPFPAGTGLIALTGLEAGSYSITVTDIYGCTQTVTFVIPEQFRDIEFDLVGKHSGCQGILNSGEILVTNINIPSNERIVNATYSNGELLRDRDPSNPDKFVNVRSDEVRVWVFDMTTGCTKIKTIQINNVEQLIAIPTFKNPGCDGNPNSGSITINVTSGTPPYTFNWSPNVSTTNTAENLAAGTYNITVIDANGCEFPIEVTLIQVAALEFSMKVVQWKNSGVCKSFAKVEDLLGTPPYTYNWNDGSTSAISNQHTGGNFTFTCTVTDANGCITVHSVTGSDCSLLIDNIIISPNPNNLGFAHIDYTLIAPGSNVKFVILNQSGSIMEEINFGIVQTEINYDLNISTYTPGAYYVLPYENNIEVPLSGSFIKP